MRTVAIIQARMGSTRLPGKIAMDLCGKSVMAWVVDAAKKASLVDAVYPAMPQYFENVAEDDVLGRFMAAAKLCNADVIVRLTADCPLLDPAIIDQVIALRARKNVEYASNVDPPSWPDGLDCEAFTMDALLDAHACAVSAYDREHVTPWMRRYCSRANLVNPAGDQSHIKLSIDTAEDLENVRRKIASAA